MREKIKMLIESYVKVYKDKTNVVSQWKQPIVKFASAKNPDFKQLKFEFNGAHYMPEDLVKNPQTIITYFLPFEESIADSNIEGKNSSREWSIAYIETNELILHLNEYITDFLDKEGYHSAYMSATHNFNEETLMSQWSHRHVAEIAGLGTFGLNNMLITEAGCCGRIGSIVTTKKMKPSKRVSKENCLYKLDGSCGVCVEGCQFGALTYDKFNRHKCYEICLSNDQYHSTLGVTDVCGKCCVHLPCSFTNPS